MLKILQNSDKLLSLQQALQDQESVLVEDLWNAPKALIAAIAQKVTGKNILLLTGGSQEEIRLFHDFTLFTDVPIVDFPAWETLPSEQVAPSPDIVGDRYRVLSDILEKKQPSIIVTGLQACLQRLIAPKEFNSMFLKIKVGESYLFELLIEELLHMGYKRQSIASDKGEFAVRGGIVDIFPVSSPDPYRIEFWGDDIESIRTYDPIGQKSVLSAQEISITPAQEMELLQKSTTTTTILDYLGPNTLVIFDDLLSLEDRYVNLVGMGGTQSSSFTPIETFLDQIDPLQKMFWSPQAIEELSEVTLLEKKKENYYSQNSPLYKIGFELFNRKFTAKRWQHSYVPISNYLIPEIPDDKAISGQEVFQALNQLGNSDLHLHILSATELEKNNFIDKIQISNIHLPKETNYHIGYLSNGFVDPETKIILFPLTEITHRYKIRRQKQRSTYHTVQSDYQDLMVGEMVVHMNHGIGRYLGLEKKIDHNGNLTEFLQLEYAEHSKLFVPLHQTNLISKYIGSSEEQPKMHSLGNNRWKRMREQTEKAILGYAKDLLQLYAHRSMKKGFIYDPDGSELKAFEEDFPYVETEDQLSAIKAIKEDMVSNSSMDRLVCGDVGYGKTEVAMRAAFKAVADGRKQVAVLVPTTVLAMQHYENFIERMSNFPINIGVLSRFRTAKQIKETLKGAEEGSVDIVIGTHRLISEDVKFKDLGLIIIDEEQRFGVRAKEHLKKIKLNVDCLTFSATPIPRTLYMSLVGARDMSTINTPPQDRLPITTLITEPNDLVIKNALLRELSRDGQAFFIHNRVETIYEMADRIKEMLPLARVVVVHGQMHADEIDSVFHAFKTGQADILVATTIVENGIDIPNANTILIDKADHFGMADLYQLRGRVGRWNRRAYCYFLVKNMHRLPEISRKRLNALAESSGYGGGMKVAMHDLEIRGAGNILGIEQSGLVAAIGFHLYCKLLKRTVQALQGEKPIYLSETKIEVYADARLPDSYIDELSLRLEFYQRFGETSSYEEIDSIWKELLDRFGVAPIQALWLYHMTRLRVFAASKGFSLVKIEKSSITTEQKNKESYKKVPFKAPLEPREFEIQVTKYLNSLSESERKI